MLQYTGGTTGRAKGVNLTHAATATNVSHEVRFGVHPEPASFDSALTARFRDHRKDDKSCCYSQCVDVKALANADPSPPVAARFETAA